MTIKEKTIRELESLDTDKVRIVYDIIKTLKRSPTEKSESMNDQLKNQIFNTMPSETVKIKKKSGSQIIQIPEGLKIKDDKVYLKKVGNSIYVIPFHNPWDSLIQSTELFTNDYLDERDQQAVQEKDLFE